MVVGFPIPMSEIIQVKRNSGGAYRVEFLKDPGRVRVRCNCTAGSIGQICRHKRALIVGNASALYEPKQAQLLQEILAWPEMRRLTEHAKRYEKELAEIETRKNAILKEEQVVKQRYASDCLDGVHGT